MRGEPIGLDGRARRARDAGAPDVPGAAMVLVNPGVAVPTGPVFAGLTTRRGVGAVDRTPPLREVNSLVTFLKMTSNDLQAPALAIAPVIGEVLGELSRMPGALLWRMSGSGATCFALFEDDGAAQMAAIALAHSHPKWWVQATRIGRPIVQYARSTQKSAMSASAARTSLGASGASAATAASA